MKHETTKTLRVGCILLFIFFLFCALTLLPQPVQAQITATVAVGTRPYGVAVTPNGAYAYVTIQQGGNSVCVISTGAAQPSPSGSTTPTITSTPTQAPTATPYSSQNPTPSPTIPEFPQTVILLAVAAMSLIVAVGLVAYRRRNPSTIKGGILRNLPLRVVS